MAEVAEAFVSLVPSARGFKAGIERELGGDLDAVGRDGGDRASKGFTDTFAGGLKGLVAPVAAAFAAVGIGQFFGDAIGKASDLNEAGTKLNQIFGDAVGSVNQFASSGAKALGQSNLDVLNAAASFGVYGKAAGLGDAANAQFSQSLVGLSTDLASFYNTDPSQAMEAIAAGLRGESEPLRAYGVLLDDATLRQKALELGLISTTKNALTPQQRVLAAQAAIMEQTSVAQGDFARTSGGLANQQRILAAQFDNLKTSLGTALLPLVLGFVTALNGAVGPVAALAGPALTQLNLGISAAGAAFKEGDVTSDGFVGAMERVGNAARAVAEFFSGGDFSGPLVTAFSLSPDQLGIIDTLEGLRSRVLDVFTGIGQAVQPAIAMFAALGPVFAGIGPDVLSLVASFSPLLIVLQSLAPVIPSLVGSLSQVFAVLAGVIAQILPPILQLASTLGGVLAAALGALVPVVAGLVPVLGGGLVVAVQALAPLLVAIVGVLGPLLQFLAPLAPVILAVVGGLKAWAAIQGILNIVLAANPIGLVVLAIAGLIAAVIAIVQHWDVLKAAAATAFGFVKDVITSVVSTVAGPVVAGLQAAWQFVADGFTSVKDRAVAIFDGIKDFFVKWWPLLLVIFFPAVAAILALWSRFGDDIVGFTLKAWGLVKQHIVEPVQAAIDFVKTVVTAIVGDVQARFAALVAGVKVVWAAFKAAVVDPVAAAVAEVNAKIAGLVQAVVGKITETYDAAKAKAAAFIEVGTEIINGLLKGLSNGLEKVKAKAKEIADGALSAAKKALGIASPSKAFIEVGEFVNAGLVQGLTSTARDVESTTSKIADNIYKGFKDVVGNQVDAQVAGIDASVDGLKRQVEALSRTADARKKNAAQLERLNAQIKDLGAQRTALNDSIESVVNARSQGLLTSIAGQTSALAGIAAQRDQVAAQIKDATKNLEDAVKLREDFAASIATSAANLGALTAVKAPGDGAITFTDIVTSLSGATTAVQDYERNLDTLRSRGLNDNLFKQLADAGASQGKAYVEAILAAGPDAVGKLNELQANLGVASKSLGDYTAKQLFQAGVDSAKGLLDGLGAREADLYATADRLAQGIADRIRKALDIHSPSRVMKGIGEQIGEGLVAGIEATQSAVGAAMGDLVSVPAVPAPRLPGARSVSALAASGVLGSGGGMPDTITLVDADGTFIARMQAEAGVVVGTSAQRRLVARRSGAPVPA